MALKRAFLCVLALSFNVFAEQIAVSQFKGINNNENSLIIDPSYAQDALNVDVTPGGKSAKKRPGYGLYKLAFSASSGIHGGIHFFDSTGNDVQLWGSSVSIKGIVADGTPATIVSSMTVGSTIDCADTQGSAYCVSSSRDFYIKTNGATLTSWFTSPLGTMIEATPDRIAVAGVSGNLSTIYHSGSNAFTNFTVGPLTTDPFQEVIAAPGSKLTHLRWACGKLLWWKDQSFGYETFDDQYALQIKIVSDNIGTFDNTSALDPGGSVWFRGQDGHIYQYDCSGLIKQSIEISPFVTLAGHRTSNSWLQTSASDFSAGASVSVDTFTSLGDVQLKGFNEKFDNLSSWSILKGSWSANSGVAVSTTPSLSYSTMITTNAVDISSNNFVLTAGYNRTVGSVGSIIRLCVVNSSTKGYCFYNFSTTTAISSTTFTNGTPTDVVLNSGISTDLGVSSHVVTLTRTAGGAMKAYVDGTLYASASSNDHGAVLYGLVNWQSGGGSDEVRVDYYKLFTATGTYYSAVNNAPNFGSWSTLNETDQTGGTNSISYFVRGATNSFTTQSSTPAWISISKNAVPPTTSTGTYFQLRSDFSLTSATETPTLNDFTFNWFEGSADQAYGIYFDNSIWFSVAYGVGVSSNTFIFKRDLINDGWTVYNFGAGGMLIQNNHLFFGSVGDGNIFQYGSGTSDNGNSINAYWKTKDFTGQEPFLENSYTQLDSYWARNANQLGTVAYTLNGSTTSTSYNVSLSSTTNSLIRSKKLLPNGTNGSTINIKFSDTSSTSQWELFLYRLLFIPFPYRPG